MDIRQLLEQWIVAIHPPYRHFAFAAMPAANSFLMHHLKDNCFGYHFRFGASGKTMFYVGNLTDQVDEMDSVDRVNVLALRPQ
jgi:hypothetical protein